METSCSDIADKREEWGDAHTSLTIAFTQSAICWYVLKKGGVAAANGRRGGIEGEISVGERAEHEEAPTSVSGSPGSQCGGGGA